MKNHSVILALVLLTAVSSRAESDVVVTVGTGAIRLSTVDWHKAEDDVDYAQNFEAKTNDPGRRYQVVTIFTIPMSDDRRVGTQLSKREYLELFVSAPGQLTALLRVDHGEYWILSRELFVGPAIAEVPLPEYGALTKRQERRARLALQNRLDRTRHLLKNKLLAR
ncbi:MAG TPA: hypothetical protein VGQ36_08045 [Thermoanaerobaculia bacterium]|jgi:hypothetical protein|nr:hypothetical protein [Thermoanaerobaculia bacterium]